jgi:5-methyltetrahydropteroyltriglutamate--homocysteine methyltransferase
LGGLNIEFANARRLHENAALCRHGLPDHMVLVPGVIDTKINLVEHPEVVAQRIGTAVAVVGRYDRSTYAVFQWRFGSPARATTYA